MSVFFPFLPSLFFRLTKYSVLAFTLFEVCIFLHAGVTTLRAAARDFRVKSNIVR